MEDTFTQTAEYAKIADVRGDMKPRRKKKQQKIKKIKSKMRI
jgi:hypothetical protein